MEIAKKIELCSGCGACENICPVNAITMIEDEKGFLYPKVNGLICTNCGLCKKVCPTNHERKVNKSTIEIYATQIKDINKRMESQSGGAFTAFAELILNKGGTVYGVGLNDKLEAEYMRVDNIEELHKLKGSKYVQAKMGNIHKLVLNDLVNGCFVMFSGTACHVDGLVSYLEKKNVDRENLLTCDLICHGTNSPRMYNDYLSYIGNKFNFDKSKGIKFRDKSKGWHNHVESFYNLKGKKVFKYGYANLFYTNLGLRESCYNCQYANLNRISDITLSDFWGIEKIKPEFDDNTGVSVLIIRSRKAVEYLNEIMALDTFKISKEDCMQHNMKEPTLRPENIIKFWNEYDDKGFIYVLKKYGRSPLKKIVIRSAVQTLEILGIKERIKKVLKLK